MTTASTPPNEYQLIGQTEDGSAGDLLQDLDQKAGRIRLQALISEWLRMENLVVLTVRDQRLWHRIEGVI